MKTGILFLNIGTPNSPSVSDVRRYLREFLSDPQVIDIPSWQRWLLLNLIILPLRPKKSAALYQNIWTTAGSPLLVHSQAFSEAVQQVLGDDFVVALGMRYGDPSINYALKSLQQAHCERILIFPLFPQYSTAATASALKAALKTLDELRYAPEIVTINAFYNDPQFITSTAAVIKKELGDFVPEYLLFSFHGVPVRQVKKVCYATCDCKAPCPAISQDNAYCYRAQSYETAHRIAHALELPSDRYSVAFQSRLGRTPWIDPDTVNVLTELSKKGIKNIAIACPSFVADCLETLEEVGIRAAEQWQELGGERLVLLPSLNSDPTWVQAVAGMIHKKLGY